MRGLREFFLGLGLLLLALSASGESRAQTEEPADTEEIARAETPPAPPPVDPAQYLDLEARELALRDLESELDSKLAALTALREALVAAIALDQEAHTAELSTLVKFYSAMKPKGAAALLEKLPVDLSTQVLAAMKARQAGKILDSMQADRAVRISRRMTGG